MIVAPSDTVQPAIDLAALALCKTDTPQVTQKAPASDGPQGSGSGSLEEAQVIGPMPAPQDEGEVANAALSDSAMGDDKSDTSMQAMDLQLHSSTEEATASAQPAPPTRAPPVPPRPTVSVAATKSKLGNIEESARQQDASEVLSNIFDLFSCAIQGKGVLREEEQLDLIKELFFSDVTSVRMIKPKADASSELRDHFLVSPGWRNRDLYATLDDDFGLNEMEDGTPKYDYIDKAAPVQIINLRRLQFDRKKHDQVYDRSHIGLETTLYLDRYLGKTESLPQLELLKLREAQWEKQRQLRILDARRDDLRRTDLEGLDVVDTIDEASAFIEELSRTYEQASLPTPPPELAEALSEKAAMLKRELAQIDKDMTCLEAEIDSVFKDSREHPYRLHAVFTHRGGTKGGHYWIYIYDFQNAMWRKYNDDHVTPADESAIFEREIAAIPAASTGVVYIREDMIDIITEAVKREPALEKGAPETTDRTDTRATDVEMRDVIDGEMLPLGPVKYHDVQVIEGVENV
jgi:ubiquitin carboxyl-terminal hydrolase 25/28